MNFRACLSLIQTLFLINGVIINKMKDTYNKYLESKICQSLEYEQYIINEKYKAKFSQIRNKIFQLVAKARELAIQREKELSDLQMSISDQIRRNCQK